MEPKLAERRKGVSEDRARGRLKWVLVIIGLLLAIIGTVWLIRSPILSIRSVSIEGAVNSNPFAVVADLDMGQGTPTIDVDTGAIERLIMNDPWVDTAVVTVSWPGSVSISVVEHTEFASVQAADGWVRVAADGSVLVTGPPVEGTPRIEIDTGPVSAGYDIANPLILGALEFSEALPPEVAAEVAIATDGEGLVVDLGEVTIILGRPVEMAAKATVLIALLDTGIEDGSIINLIAPLRPAVTNPQPQLEPEA